MTQRKFIFIVIALALLTLPAMSQVLGSCGGDQSGTAVTEAKLAGEALVNQPIPLPGQYAIDFELPAVVGNDIKNIKLSDYNGKWRIVCFFPAAFTFV